MKVIGDPVSPEEVAVSVFVAAVAPNVHEPTVAMPDASVVAVSPVAEPPPVATANVTEIPALGLPPESVTRTEGGIVTAVPTVAD